MSLPVQLHPIRDRPALYGLTTFEATVAYLNGYDDAILGSLLNGFREWLIVRAGGGSNLSWPALVENAMRLQLGEQGQKDSPEAAVFILRTLDEYHQVRSAPDGLRRVYLAYEKWLKRQSWYGPDSSQWLGI